ncbi:MAG: RNA 2',3'-cyclic phosphodiesterase [Proteobacteria bacterium]|nr:MAG: RNA 2',3'-cyclic phosphodiesterase [Pseudomonadota bacterium]PIE18556.1 MAG: RNA 2',3'-cyclic phosphodiesterase [Pseudomonadota bacterium]
MERIRAFVALNLPLDVLGELAEVQKTLRARARAVDRRLSWVPAANMHVTLKFLGDIPVEASYAIRDRLERELAGRESFPLSVGGLGVFPDQRRPRVLWAGVADGGEDGAGALMQLAADVEGWLDELGFEPDGRGFHAHVTLGRFKRGATASDAAGAEFWSEVEAPEQETRAVEIALYKSELTRSGAEYTALARYPLVSPDPPEPDEPDVPDALDEAESRDEPVQLGTTDNDSDSDSDNDSDSDSDNDSDSDSES